MTNVVSSEAPAVEDKQKIRPIYSELQGYLSHTPKDENLVFYEREPQWKQVNETIDLLNTATGKKYDRFKLTLLAGSGGSNFVRVTTYKQKLSGLISYLHGEYFYDEQPPFSGMPNTVITHNLSQQQSQQQTMTVALLDLQSKIDQRLSKTTDEKEKSFLRKLKEQLPTVVSVMQLINLIFNIAHQTGVNIHTVRTLLA